MFAAAQLESQTHMTFSPLLSSHRSFLAPFLFFRGILALKIALQMETSHDESALNKLQM